MNNNIIILSMTILKQTTLSTIGTTMEYTSMKIKHTSSSMARRWNVA